MPFYFIVLALILIFFLTRFAKRISNLENEIQDLKKQLNTSEKPFIEEKTIVSEPKISDEKPEFASEPKIITAEKKEKSTPIFTDEIPLENPKTEDWTDILFGFVKQNLLTIIGIFTLVLGIGYFVKYAIDRNWIGEFARFSIGMFVGIAILGIGYFLKKNYKIFSAIISGGGLAVLYLSVTLAFQEYELFSQNFSFILLILITALAVSIAYFYDSETLMIFALIGGFGAPLMVSNGQSNYAFLFTYISLLNIGMLIIAYLKNWKSIGWFAFVATFLYFGTWILDHTDSLAIYFLVFSYLIFYAFGLRKYFKKQKLETYDVLLLILTNVFVLVGISYIFKSLKLEPLIIFPLIFAAINIILWINEGRKTQQLYHPIFVAISLSLITIAVALQFKTSIITTIWAIEGVLLIYFWRKTNQQIFKTAFNFLLPLILLSEIFTWSQFLDETKTSVLFNPIFLTGILVSICLGASYYLMRDQLKGKDVFNFSFDNELKFIAIANAFLVGLFEIFHQYHNQDSYFVFVTALLYAMYFFAAILAIQKYFLKSENHKIFIYIILFLSLIIALVPEFPASVMRGIYSYGYYLLYLPPVIFAIFSMIKGKFTLRNYDFWILALVITYLVSFEFSHFYIYQKFSSVNLSENDLIRTPNSYFIIFYLPIIWTVLAVTYIFIGLKKDFPELTKIGFVLITIMAVKLYGHDVWGMDNISRIIAFIVLGLILLSSSFTFQKLKGIFKNIVENKENENPEKP